MKVLHNKPWIAVVLVVVAVGLAVLVGLRTFGPGPKPVDPKQAYSAMDQGARNTYEALRRQGIVLPAYTGPKLMPPPHGQAAPQALPGPHSPQGQ